MTNYGNGRGPGLEPHAEALPAGRGANCGDLDAILAMLRAGKARLVVVPCDAEVKAFPRDSAVLKDGAA